MTSERSMMRLCVGQNSGCLTRVWHSLWSWLKLMRSLRAAVVKRTGIEIKPKVRCPFQTVEAMPQLLFTLRNEGRFARAPFSVVVAGLSRFLRPGSYREDPRLYFPFKSPMGAKFLADL